MFETLGALKDIPDSRDYPFGDTRIAKTAKATAYLPDFVDWSMYSPPIKDQLGLGSCVSTACSSAREFLVRTLDPNSQIQYSPLFLYLKARQIMGSYPNDSGLYTRDALKALQTYGISDEVSWPYLPDKFNDEPPTYTYVNATWKKIYTYHRLETNTIEEMEQCLGQQHCFVLSMSVFGNLTLMPLINGVLQIPDVNEKPVGGHAILIIGMHRSSKMFHAQNSWSSSWGINGKFWIPYEYISRHVWDSWAIVG